MADEDELLVQVEGEDQTDNENDGHEERPEDVLKAQFDALKADNEKRIASEAAAHRRAADERARADAASREAAEAKATVADRELDTIVSGIAAAQAEAEAAEQAWAAAAEAGDFKKQAEANKRLSLATARQTQLETAKAQVESAKSGNGGDRSGEFQQRRSVDPFEDHVSRFTPRTADWMRQHRDWVIDPRKSKKLESAHHLAVTADLEPDTDEYFAHVEKTLGLRQDEQRLNGTANGQHQRTSSRRASPVVAPVNGGAGAHSSGTQDNRGPTVTLTKSEEQMALNTITWNRGERDAKGNPLKDGDPRIGQPIGVQEYARRKLSMRKQGFYREG